MRSLPLFAVTALFAGSAWAGASNDFSGTLELAKDTKSLTVVSVESNVSIRVDPAAEEPTVEATDFRPGRACKLKVDGAKGGAATIRFGPKDQEDAQQCRLDLEIAIPPSMEVSLELDKGVVKATGMAGALEAKTGKGDVTLAEHAGKATVDVAEGDLRLESVSGELQANVGKGQVTGMDLGPATITVGDGAVELTGLSQVIRVDIGVGNTKLTYATAPSGELVVNSSQGNVVVDLPTGTQVKAQLSSLSGSATSKLPDGGDLDVVVVAGMGEVLIH